MLKQKLSTHHSLISTTIQEFISKNKEEFSNHYWADDVFTRLSEYSTGGKMVRGGLVIESYLEFSKPEYFEFSKNETSPQNPLDKNKKIPQNVIQIAAAIELFSSGLLIHDDIIDRDEMRRGKPSIHTQYKNLVQDTKYPLAKNSDNLNKNHHNSDHFGKSMGIFIGDIEYFLSYSLISESKVDSEIKNKLLALFSKELIGVSLAQLNDVNLSFEDTKTDINKLQSTTDKTLNKILEIYRLKTARYSLVLPMLAGSIMAKQDKNVLDIVEEFAENIGIIFQIKDDEMDIFGDSEKTGKPVGGDIKEGKKTIFWYYAMKMADDDTKIKLESIFGNKDIDQTDIDFVKSHLIDSGAMQKINEIVNIYADKSKNALKKLSKQQDSLFSQLISYNLSRDK